MQNGSVDHPPRNRILQAITMACLVVNSATACRGVPGTSEPRLFLTANSRLVLFAPYREAAEFESVGLSVRLAKALSGRSGQQESWQAAIVGEDAIVTTTFTSAPLVKGGRAPSVMVISGKGATH